MKLIFRYLLSCLLVHILFVREGTWEQKEWIKFRSGCLSQVLLRPVSVETIHSTFRFESRFHLGVAREHNGVGL